MSEAQLREVNLLPQQLEYLQIDAEWAGMRGGKGSGKTTANGWYIIQRLEQYPLANHYIAGATFPQLREGSFQTVVGLLETSLGWKRGTDFDFREKSQSPTLTFKHSGAELKSLTSEQGDKINSIEIQTLICEEPQTWENGQASFGTMMTRLRESQTSKTLYPDMKPQGRLSFNPPSQGHWLYDMIERRWPKMGYPCLQFNTRDNYLLSPSYVRMLEGTLPERQWASEIEGNWRTASESFFPEEDLNAAEDFELTEQFVELARSPEDQRLSHGELFINDSPWHAVQPRSRYVHFWDLADKQDWTVGITLDTSYGDRMTVVEFERFNRTGWDYVYDRIRDRHARYSMGYVGGDLSGTNKTYLDATGVGDPVLNELQDIQAEGLVFTSKTKPEALVALQSALSKRTLKFPMIPVMFDELRFYERDDKDIVQDCVMALAGAVNFGARSKAFVPAVFA